MNRDEMLARVDDDRKRRAVAALTDLRQTHLTRREWA